MFTTKYKNSENGYSMVELLVALFVGSIVLAGAYTSYSVIAAQYQRNSGVGSIRDFAIPTINIVSRDLRMAGYRAVDNNIQSTFNKISPPITITDVNGACCDTMAVTYDKDLNTRVRVTYFTAARTNPARNALYMNIDTWNGNAWVSQTANAIVADYVDDFQVEGANNNSDGFPTLVNYNLVFKSKNKLRAPVTFTKSAYASGNNNGYTVTDNYLREEFDTSVVLRNLE